MSFRFMTVLNLNFKSFFETFILLLSLYVGTTTRTRSFSECFQCAKTILFEQVFLLSGIFACASFVLAPLYKLDCGIIFQ
jgi:predicted membrane protein